LGTSSSVLFSPLREDKRLGGGALLIGTGLLISRETGFRDSEERGDRDAKGVAPIGETEETLNRFEEEKIEEEMGEL